MASQVFSEIYLHLTWHTKSHCAILRGPVEGQIHESRSPGREDSASYPSVEEIYRLSWITSAASRSTIAGVEPSIGRNASGLSALDHNPAKASVREGP